MEYKYFPVTITNDGRKIPLVKDWGNLATNDTNQLQQWQAAFRGRLTHWGIPTGQTTGLLVLDLDTKGEDNGFKSIEDNRLVIPQTANQRTLTGGAHYIFEYPNDGEHYGNRAKVYPGVDVRGEGGYIVAYDIQNIPIQPAPDWLKQEARRNYHETTGEAALMNANLAEDKFQASLQVILGAAGGERNVVFNTEAFKIKQLVEAGGIAEMRARAELERVGKELGLDADEIPKTLNSAFKGGALKPIVSPFGPPPEMGSPVPLVPAEPERWTPKHFTLFDLNDTSKLKRPQLFKDWSTADIHITTADGGTGKTTLKLYEAVCLALGERFLGFDCVNPGKTLFITGEDTAAKLGAIIGAITKQMGISNDSEKMNKILDSIVVKKDSDLCLIVKDRYGFLHPSLPDVDKVLQAVEDIKPRMIVFDPISAFWGSESAVNDMAKAVSKFMARLVEESGACVEMINHMGKQSSNNKDMSQFAGRGGTGLPSHSRVSRVLRLVDNEEFTELTGGSLPEGHNAMMCNIGKFTDGSPLLNKQFLITRQGFLFSRIDLAPQVQRDKDQQQDDSERVFKFVKDCRDNKQWPTKNIIIAHFMSHTNKLSEAKTKRALDLLSFSGYQGKYKLRPVQGPDVEITEKVYIITDLEGNEV